jgi:alpha-1,3-rhamnosyl/mannosyltransferase
MWARAVDWFWKLPVPLALLVRLAIHLKRELMFRRAVSGMDLYHEAGFFPFSVPSNVKVVFTLHDLSLFRFPQHHPRERVLYARLFLQRRCRRVNRFLTVSRFTREEAIRVLGISRNQITVTHLAHDATVFYPRSDLDRPLILNGKKLPERYFLFVGSGDPRKNLDVIPAALEKTGLSIPLVTVGWSGWLETKQGDNILQLGYVSDADLARVYSRAIALVFPSEYEGFGLPILEAMACGCPVITTRNASIPEVAADAALFMDHPLDVSGLARMLSRLAQDQILAESLRQKGLAQSARFSWAATASASWEALQQVLANRSPN